MLGSDGEEAYLKSEAASVDVKIDRVEPTLTLQVEGTLDKDSGWYITQPVVTVNPTVGLSGIAECWGKVPFTNLAINNRGFATYYSNAFLYNFPFTFYEIPIVSVQSYNAGAWTSISSISASQLGFRLNRNESGTLTDTAFVIVKGLWKALKQVGGVVHNYLNSLRVRWQYV